MQADIKTDMKTEDQLAGSKLQNRIYAVDLLRGIVMMIMMIDHIREFVHAGALTSDPTDPATTTVAVFFTRWITHFCAPTFVFLSGVSIYLQKLSGKSNDELSRFLWTRGLWLIFLEFTLIRFLIVFNVDYTFFGMAQVIWVIGVSMIAMAVLIYFPIRVVGIAGGAMVLLHNLLDGTSVPPATAFAGTPPPTIGQAFWLILHQVGIIPVFGSANVFFAYPLIPWIGVMAAGYALGQVYSWDGERRRKMLFVLGAITTVGFVVLRGINIYGDPIPWKHQETTVGTFLSFLNTAKYPPSLLYLLMTLGPGLLILALTDLIDGKALWQRVCIVFGRVPMFYYMLQWIVAHVAGVLLAKAAGIDSSYLFLGIMSMGRNAPKDYGFPLWVVYAVWIVGLILVYPLCKWWGNLKKRNKHWALSYF